MITSAKVRFKWLEGCVAVLLLAISGAEIAIFSPPVEHATHRITVSVKSVDTTDHSSSLAIAITHGPLDSSIRLVAFPLTDKPARQRAIFVFNDSSYPTANVDQTAGDKILYHLAGELGVRHYSAAITGVTVGALRDVLAATAAASSRAIVMMTGVWPASVFSRNMDMVTPWVRSGGLVIWGGASVGYWSAVAGQSLGSAPELGYGESGTQVLLGKGIAVYPWVNQRTGTVRSDFATALGISYRFASAGILRDPAIARGGLSLGWYSGGYSSVTYLPSGDGGYLLFGGEILDAEAVSHDLLQIVLSGALTAAGPVAATDLQLRDVPASSIQHWDIPFAPTKTGLMLVAFDPNPDGIFYYGPVRVQ